MQISSDPGITWDFLTIWSLTFIVGEHSDVWGENTLQLMNGS